MPQTVWFITGTTSGIGAALVNHILSRGDKVIASGRNVQKKLNHLKSQPNAFLLELDVAAEKLIIEAQVKKAWEAFGHVDVLINNAGMSALRTAEDADDTFVNTIFQVNLFGHLHMSQAILPYFRAQGHGTIAFTSSGCAWGALPYLSHYCMTKAALSSFAESVHKEVSHMGIKCVAFDLGGFPTRLAQPRDGDDAAGDSAVNPDEVSFPESPVSEPYAETFGEYLSLFLPDPSWTIPGDPNKAASAMVDVIRRQGAAAGRPWAVRVVLGSDCLTYARKRRQEELRLLEKWQDVSSSTDTREFALKPEYEKYIVVAGLEE
ncbi:NAD(P)-binding protein [Trichoderma reesei RUT C-30]|uniref:NAD(P)-binding protein n=1 Tax=Hypocrea jecorina (strain ATCC 56765 / BCRC 32924 / NRRL 11460 / Rut C-30) TaxID=1344414 RepID=A0A024S360_HYPJR|nr:NAD(P)-binding protein [Trichoderma reesei RUT C-30]